MLVRRILQRPHHDGRGFTLVELMVTLLVFALVVAAITRVIQGVSRSRESNAQQLASEQGARAVLDLVTRDIRSAGYGTDASGASPQPAIAYVDSLQVILGANLAPWPDTLGARRQTPQAYSPTGSPKPAPLDGTTWAPPTKYQTGAELVRYTLDVNNDGLVDANDIASPQGADAAMTPNPGDYVLVRQVYGDSTNNTLGDNGGAQERVALVSRPGGPVPPLFTVYLRGSATPWNWANGPVPPARLQDIERIQVSVTVAATTPDARRQYPSTTLSTQINALRSVPDWGVATSAVSGMVFDDLDKDGALDAGESGLANVTVRLGNYVGYTSAVGFYSMRVPNGTYTLSHAPPSGYGVFTRPDSFIVTVAGAAVSRSFADTIRQGGWVTVHVFEDADGDGVEGAGEPPLSGIECEIEPGDLEAFSDLNGDLRLFAPAAHWQVECEVPDSMIATTPNPLAGTMADRGAAAISFGLEISYNGTIRGAVFRDNNRNGVADGGEAGLGNVWVGVTTDDGLTVQGYSRTDATGDYSIVVPANDPPHTRAYSVFLVPPAGFFPTNSTTIGSLWLQANQVLTGKNFGMSSFQVITLNASRVLSLVSGDLIEADWNGNQTQNARRDADILLGADAGGTDNVSAWFNQYASSPLFNGTASYSRLAPNSVMAMALDTLDQCGARARPDLVTGTKLAASGNIFVWFNQGTNNNEGFLPAAYSAGQNYRTNDGGDVQAVLTADCSGGGMPEILVGSKSPLAGHGTVEVWQNSDATTPVFARQEIYPASGGVPGASMGEVVAMALADFDGDGVRDLVVGTRTGSYMGEVMFFRCAGRTNGNRFVWRNTIALLEGAVTSLAVTDMNADGQRDVVVGTQRSTSQGQLIYLRNKHNISSWGFDKERTVDAPGIVLSLSVADLGGGSGTMDLVVGWRRAEGSYGGGVTIYYLDLHTLPSVGVDPSNGTIVSMVPASTIANLNYGLNTTTPPSPWLTDIAVGVKSGAATGALVIFIR